MDGSGDVVIDIDYEFSAPKWFDFIKEESDQQIHDGHLWDLKIKVVTEVSEKELKIQTRGLMMALVLEQDLKIKVVAEVSEQELKIQTRVMVDACVQRPKH
nr:protein TPX2 [Tanacetum cinerariifolium]